MKNNAFTDSWACAPISDWYCEGDKRDDCTKASAECPSANNVLEKNTMTAKKIAGTDLSKVFGADRTPSCPAPLAPRFIVVQ